MHVAIVMYIGMHDFSIVLCHCHQALIAVISLYSSYINYVTCYYNGAISQ